MKKTLATLAIIAVLALTGCDVGKPDETTGAKTNIEERHVTLNDGREITCLRYKSGYAGGLSCDWAGAK
ncbi:hypothetical protein ART_1598 [Arthrobacter sp. PAMC 25486]|uniref:hypothetical protein n=1 Tax=Arthrobacter sp. PAMC 25486 TaxID=1494608 RepID=UPI000536121D|nr:hypothetical protein [Arthrobacter sp. PAMC 25486]AIY01197.1 hypothetical protein ART_1598 [Arthrobacter sp. PAMC 25486]